MFPIERSNLQCLLQADEEKVIEFTVEQFRLPCGTQWLKVRDGRSLSSRLLADLSGAADSTPSVVNSSGPNLLLEFFTDEVAAGGHFCGGGFLAHAMQISKKNYCRPFPFKLAFQNVSL